MEKYTIFRVKKVEDIYTTIKDEFVSISIHFGCNGKEHVIQLIKEYADNNGNISYAEELSVTSLGSCDGKCRDAPENGFSHY